MTRTSHPSIGGVRTLNGESSTNGMQHALSLALVAPDPVRSEALESALTSRSIRVTVNLREYPADPATAGVAGCALAVVDVDADADAALDLVEGICALNPAPVVIVSSSREDSDLILRCMRAGARELIGNPITSATVLDAVTRASALVPERQAVRTGGQLLMFLGAKGGSGATTIASNVAVALARESGAKAALVDLHLQLGDAALALGMKPAFSVQDALHSADRLDKEFVRTLITTHEASGLNVLAGSDSIGANEGERPAIRKLFRILRDDFDWVVVDGGSVIGEAQESLLAEADRIYVITEVTLAGLRNANRLITHLADLGLGNRVECVLNKWDARKVEIDDNRIGRALTKAPAWKIPADTESVRRAENEATTLVDGNSPAGRMLLDMARKACGKRAPDKKRRFGLFG